MSQSEIATPQTCKERSSVFDLDPQWFATNTFYLHQNIIDYEIPRFTLHSLRFLRSLRVKRSSWSSSDAPNTAAQNCKNLICLCCEIGSMWGNIEARLLPVPRWNLNNSWCCSFCLLLPETVDSYAVASKLLLMRPGKIKLRQLLVSCCQSCSSHSPSSSSCGLSEPYSARLPTCPACAGLPCSSCSLSCSSCSLSYSSFRLSCCSFSRCF